jgi:hypothetical protein
MLHEPEDQRKENKETPEEQRVIVTINPPPNPGPDESIRSFFTAIAPQPEP